MKYIAHSYYIYLVDVLNYDISLQSTLINNALNYVRIAMQWCISIKTGPRGRGRIIFQDLGGGEYGNWTRFIFLRSANETLKNINRFEIFTRPLS